MLAGAGLGSLAFRFLMASPACGAQRMTTYVEEAVLRTFRPRKGRRVHAKYKEAMIAHIIIFSRATGIALF
jgi:hypothetical protein